MFHFPHIHGTHDRHTQFMQKRITYGDASNYFLEHKTLNYVKVSITTTRNYINNVQITMIMHI
jgi:hypothetical protein